MVPGSGRSVSGQQAARLAVVTLLRSIFAQPDAEAIRIQHRRLVRHLDEHPTDTYSM